MLTFTQTYATEFPRHFRVCCVAPKRWLSAPVRITTVVVWTGSAVGPVWLESERKNIYIRWRLRKMQLIDTLQNTSKIDLLSGHYKLTPSTLGKFVKAQLSGLLKVLFSSLDLFNQTSFLLLWEAPTHATIEASKLIAQISTTVYRQLFIDTTLWPGGI